MKKIPTLLLVTAPLALMAQPAEVPADLATLPLDDIFVSVTTLSGVVLPLTGWLRNHLLKKADPQQLSWAVAVALAFVGYALKLGLFAETGPVWTAIYGLAAGLISNGLADHGLIKFALRLIGAKIEKKK